MKRRQHLSDLNYEALEKKLEAAEWARDMARKARNLEHQECEAAIERAEAAEKCNAALAERVCEACAQYADEHWGHGRPNVVGSLRALDLSALIGEKM